MFRNQIISKPVMIDKSRIAIVTTVVSFKLYKKTAILFPKGIDKIVIDGTTGLYGINSIKTIFRKKIFKKYDWIILADEDVFFYDSNLVFRLIEQMQEQKYSICGVRDGGVIKHRFDNPLAVNTFFCIIDYKEIVKEFTFDKVLECQRFFPELYLNEDYSNLPYEYNIKSLKEPYYCFYFWLKLNRHKFLYLETVNPVDEDEFGNIILSENNEKIAFHSWYARAYDVNEKHTKRINSVLNNFDLINAKIKSNDYSIVRFPFYNWKKRIKKFIKKIFKLN